MFGATDTPLDVSPVDFADPQECTKPADYLFHEPLRHMRGHVLP